MNALPLTLRRPVASDRERSATRSLSAPHLAGLGGVLLLAAFLNCWALSRNGLANTYYSGAIRSMLGSWSNVFYLSFDQGGLVSIDKPPLALWLQAGSAEVFGLSSWSLLLPEAIAGVVAVWLLYLTVARAWGSRTAGLVAALVLAVSPVSVAVDRDNNPDALFVCLLVAACYFGVRAAQEGRLRWLLWTAVFVGLAFETKMLVAAIVVPGCSLAYLAFSGIAVRRRLAHLTLAAGVLAAVSLAWLVAVWLTPATDRPWVGSTTDNSVWSLLFGYNGVGRVGGQTGGTSTGAGSGVTMTGSPGIFRLLNDSMGDQAAWLLPLAIVGGLTALVVAFRAGDRTRLAALAVLGGWFLTAAVVFSASGGIVHSYYLSALAPASAALVGIGVVALGRLVLERGFEGVLATVAALGLTAWVEWALLSRTDYATWLRPVALGGTVLAVALLVAGTGVAAQVRRRLVGTGLAVGLAALLAAPAVWAQSTMRAPVSGVFPGAGPSSVTGLATTTNRGFGGGGFGNGGAGSGNRGGGFAPPAGAGAVPPSAGTGGTAGGAAGPGFSGGRGMGGGASAGDTTTALAYATANGATARFPLIVLSQESTGALVAAGSPVAALGGFSGRETVISPAYLASLVAAGDARWFLLPSVTGGGPSGTWTNATGQAITTACTAVSGSVTGLYDCSGRAAAIAAS